MPLGYRFLIKKPTKMKSSHARENKNKYLNSDSITLLRENIFKKLKLYFIKYSKCMIDL